MCDKMSTHLILSYPIPVQQHELQLDLENKRGEIYLLLQRISTKNYSQAWVNRNLSMLPPQMIEFDFFSLVLQKKV